MFMCCLKVMYKIFWIRSISFEGILIVFNLFINYINVIEKKMF